MRSVRVRIEEVEFSAIRAQGAGGQNVNKVSNAAHLRFDIVASSLPGAIKERLSALSDQRVTEGGVVVIKAQTSRSLEKNKSEALARLQEMVDSVAVLPKKRTPTKPTRASQTQRVDSKVRRGMISVKEPPPPTCATLAHARPSAGEVTSIAQLLRRGTAYSQICGAS